eukprot:SAG31_NODE_3458_length_4250_cov_1.904601_1_plen_48_part_00
MAGVYDSQDVMPATEASLIELRKLFPPPFRTTGLSQASCTARALGGA